MPRYTRPRAAALRKPRATLPPELEEKGSSRGSSVSCVRPLEKELQGRLVETAKLCGWLVFHDYDSRRSDIGFPDLVMVRDGKLLAIEVKRGLFEVASMARSDSGKAQLDWVVAMHQVPGCRAAVVSPENEAMAIGWILERR